MLEKYKKTGVMPEALSKKPVIPWSLTRYLEAYQQMAGQRQLGYGTPQPLSITDIIFYGLTHGFNNDMEFFFKVVTSLDEDTMEEQAKKMRSKSGHRKAPPALRH